jgi:MoaA/NifB/PqqE/SkfB family radical SAM enzyme
MLKLISKNTLKKIIRNPVHSIAVGKDRIRTQIAVSYMNGYSPHPKNLTFFLTYRCNLRCNVCGQWGITGYVKKFSDKEISDELEIAALKRVVDEVSSFKPQITMCGGETLLYKDWFEFMSHVKSRQLECVLTTNGTMLAKNAEKIVDLGLDKLSLSLDGPEKIHNTARGADNAFQMAICGIELVNEYKKKKNKKTPIIEIGCTISDQNYAHLEEVADIVESLNVRALIFLHLFFLKDNVFKRQETLFQEFFQTESVLWSGYRYNPQLLDVDELVRKLKEIKNNQRKFEVIIYPDFTDQEIKEYYNSPVFLSSSYKNVCLAPWTSVYILPNGDVSPCSSFVAGNIRDGSFSQIWNNKKFKNFRRELRKRKFFPVCSRCCELYKY